MPKRQSCMRHRCQVNAGHLQRLKNSGGVGGADTAARSHMMLTIVAHDRVRIHSSPDHLSLECPFFKSATMASNAASVPERYCSKLLVAGSAIASGSTRSSMKHSADGVLLA